VPGGVIPSAGLFILKAAGAFEVASNIGMFDTLI